MFEKQITFSIKKKLHVILIQFYINDVLHTNAAYSIENH